MQEPVHDAQIPQHAYIKRAADGVDVDIDDGIRAKALAYSAKVDSSTLAAGECLHLIRYYHQYDIFDEPSGFNLN